MRSAHVLLALVASSLLASAVLAGDDPSSAAATGESTCDVVFLAEERPVFLRLRVSAGDRPFDAAWPESIRTIHAGLDRDGDGKVTTKEADPTAVAALVRLATGGAAAVPLGDLDSHPKDGVVSTDELAEYLRPALGPFRVQIGRLANNRTDALFDHLDRDKDGQLTRPELGAIAGSLRRLDLDDNEMIGADELEPFNSPTAMAIAATTSERKARYTAIPPVLELVAGESSLRLARILLKKYDKGRGDVPGRPDNKLSPSEFAIDPAAFSSADKNGDDELDMDELRRFLTRLPIDLVLDVTFAPTAPARATARAGGEDGKDLPKGTKVRQLADGDIEVAVGRVRLDIHIDDGSTAAETARTVLMRRFQAADANKDGYLEGQELAALNAAQSPLAGLSVLIDRDGNGKLYAKELVEFTDRQTQSAQDRLVLTASDQGRAIFGILDLDRDRRLGAREVMRTIDRVTSWDSDGDGRIAAEEIPYHFQVTIARGGLAALAGEVAANPIPGPMAAARPTATAVGPEWFRQMDRNHDGDISRREFLGPREQFDRLDRDKDGLIDADEAGTASAAAKTSQPHVGP